LQHSGAALASGQGLVERARQHIGEAYRFVDVPKDDPNWHGPWDCAEFISWLVYQEAGILYGCDDNNGNPHTANAWTGYWRRDVAHSPIRAPVEQAAATPGGILLRYPPGLPGKYGHIVLADGHGGTIEAMGRAYGVRAGKVAGRVWHAGILLPEISYGEAGPIERVAGPARIFSIDAPNMDPEIVTAIQRALEAKGFDPGNIDGEFGEKTMKAVVAFQDAQGIVVDGQVGVETAGLLGVDLAIPPPTQGGLVRGVPQPTTAGLSAGGAQAINLGGQDVMGPLIPIALQLLPGLINLTAGDESGALGNVIGKTVSDITGVTDPAAAKQKIESDPALAAQLQLKLAQIAADQEQKRNETQLATLRAQQDQHLAMIKAQMDQDAILRRDELESFKASVQDVQDARQRAYDSWKIGGPAAWAPSIISLFVTVGFFGTFYYLVQTKINASDGTYQLVNLTLGALVAAFTTVVSFWLGSSQGSRNKDIANADIQAAQVKERNETIKAQNQTIQSTARQAPPPVVIASPPPSPQGAQPKTSNFRTCVDIVFGKEGEFADDPRDSGGPTNMGITLDTLNDWRRQRGQPPATIDDVKNLSRDEAIEIYRTNYWNLLRCDDLPAGVDLAAFDFAVNSGAGRAARLLQDAVGAKDDGSVGSATVGAAKAIPPAEVIKRLMERRRAFVQGAKGFDVYGRGWIRRINEIEKGAMAMAEQATAVA
jgi:lysozyme family protein